MTIPGTEGRTATGPFIVSIEDVAAPATFKSLETALAALWEALRVLPLGWTQFNAYQYFLNRPDAVERVSEFLARDGWLELTFAMAGRSHSVRVRAGGAVDGPTADAVAWTPREGQAACLRSTGEAVKVMDHRAGLVNVRLLRGGIERTLKPSDLIPPDDQPGGFNSWTAERD
ncbi:hypothetical protein OHV05_30725 [Kitasatospora sp. NBC_00070]|uniref:hypothetical protein n=1 Tax=Kitasatospora sp. NBC_00070 TaxID=2975962 RepID=UPI0032542ECD